MPSIRHYATRDPIAGMQTCSQPLSATVTAGRTITIAVTCFVP